MWKRLVLRLGLKNSWNYKENKPLVITNLILVGMALFASLPKYLSPYSEDVSSIPKAPSIEQPPSATSRVLRIECPIKKNMTFSDVLASYDFSQDLIHQLVETSKPIYNLRKLIPGNHFELEKLADGTLLGFRYDVDLDKYLNVYRTEEGYKAELRPFQYQTQVSFIEGSIHGSLFHSINELDEKDQLALDLSEIFSWDLDFNTELQEGDHFRLAAEKLYVDGKFVKYGKILAADFANNGREYSGYYFVDPTGRADYYDSQGNSLRREFLKSPLRFFRVSSTFSHRRFHPLLQGYRPHLGVDYAAPTGTPVVAAGNGRIQFAAWKQGYGRFIQIVHGNGLTTMYGHLSGFAPEIHRGSEVKQGQLIGYVGSSGLATGPHLDYRVTRMGRFVNPLSLKFQPSTPVRPEYMAAFKAELAKWQWDLAHAGKIPIPPQVSALQPR
ncbi:MAG TPA: peptidoglycan DD-metalloendopeptidase family protein [Terriglobia bacterium]|nr:peptidoglycan DD-metalloendopeptidase family protein [Terriglobia bacterium]